MALPLFFHRFKEAYHVDVCLVGLCRGALGGATLAYLRIVKNTVSMPLALGHGLFAATGLGLLAYGLIETGGTLLTVALGVFLLAALGGFTLFSYHLRSRQLPIPLECRGRVSAA